MTVPEWFRIVPVTVRVGDEDIVLCMREHYLADNPGVPVHVKISGPKGLISAGEIGPAWREMLQVLGVTPPAPPAAQTPSTAATPEPDESEPSPQAQNQLALPEASVVSVVPAHVPAPPELVPAPHEDEFFGEVGMDGNQAQPASKKAAATKNDGDEEEVEPDVELDDMELDEESPNVLRESLIRILNQPVYSSNPPREIGQDVVSEIANVSSEAEAVDLIGDLDANINLMEMRDEAAKRAEKLLYLEKAHRAKRCQHVKANGDGCGSPALREHDYCYFHGQMRAGSIEIPVIEDQHSLQLAFVRLAQQVAASKIDPAQAKVLLQIFESAGRNLPAESRQE
jgi:hypothetical protein